MCFYSSMRRLVITDQEVVGDYATFLIRREHYCHVQGITASINQIISDERIYRLVLINRQEQRSTLASLSPLNFKIKPALYINIYISYIYRCTRTWKMSEK